MASICDYEKNTILQPLYHFCRIDPKYAKFKMEEIFLNLSSINPQGDKITEKL